MVKYYYDGNGNLTKQATQSNAHNSTTPTFDVVEYAYDSTNNMVKSTQYANGETLPQITQYYYDESGNVLRMYTGLTSPLTINGLDDISSTDTSFSTFRYEYDKLGRLVKFTDALGKSETYTYDYAGNVLTKTDRDGYTITTTYNWRGQPLTMTSSKDNTSVSYTYDSLGNRKTMTDSTGTTSYTYDNLSRLSTETTSTGYTKAYTYDNNNNVLSFTLSDADGGIMNNTYAYTSLNRLNLTSNGSGVARFTYDANGNLTRMNNPCVTTQYTYNKANWQTRVKNIAANTDDIIGYYNYDGTLARTSAVFDYGDKDDLTTNYTYDGLNRLTAESMTAEEGSSVSGYSDAYTFDDNNNRATLDNGSYSYDANNRMTSSPDTDSYVYYDNGNLSADGTYAYVYDGFNRLKEIRDYYDFNTVLASYTYNGDGQRITKTVDGVTTTYVWNGDNIVYETTGTTEQKYYYGTSLYAMEDTNGNVYYYGKNIHGDIVELYDEDGEYVRDYRYDAFGNQKTANANDTNPFRYAGEYYDKETGLIYLRNRYYDTKTGRFITEDPIRDGLNWYVYCGNNPIRYVDPNGTNFGDVVYGAAQALDEGNFGGAVAWVAKKFLGKGSRDIDSEYDYYLGRVIGDALSGLVGAGTSVVGVAEVLGSIAAGGAITIGSGGTLSVGGVSISTAGVAAGTATATYGGTVVKISNENFHRDFRKMQQASDKMSKSEITAAAKRLGFEKTNYTSHGQTVYYNKKTRKYISYDVDGHNGGVWKMADSVKNLGNKNTRLGTYDINLKRIGD